jgi:hypothetical protein
MEITILLPDAALAFVHEQARAAGLSSPGDYVRNLVENAHQLRELESQLIEGMESGFTDLTAEDWSEMRREAQAELGRSAT